MEQEEKLCNEVDAVDEPTYLLLPEQDVGG